jgi:hypothetical protein
MNQSTSTKPSAVKYYIYDDEVYTEEALNKVAPYFLRSLLFAQSFKTAEEAKTYARWDLERKFCLAQDHMIELQRKLSVDRPWDTVHE